MAIKIESRDRTDETLLFFIHLSHVWWKENCLLHSWHESAGLFQFLLRPRPGPRIGFVRVEIRRKVAKGVITVVC